MHNPHESAGSLSFEEKLIKLLHHWMDHNEEHSENYKDWADKADEAHLHDAAAYLREAADMSIKQNEIFKKALEAAGHKH